MQQDPSGWDYVNIRSLNNWRNQSDETLDTQKWSTRYTGNQGPVFLGNMKSHSQFYN